MNAYTSMCLRPDAGVHPPSFVPPSLIRIDAVTKIFEPRGGTTVMALNSVTLDVAGGEIMGVIGRSGAGKSTLVRIINGLERPTSGRATVADVAISDLPERDARAARRAIGMVFQHFNLLSSRTAAGNVALALEIAGTPQAQREARVTEMLELVGLADVRGRYPSELSGGQKQRVGIARALATRPKVLLCDEATSSLDPETTHQTLALLKRIRDELALTIVLITHEMSVVKAVADQVAVLESGQIVEQGPALEIFAHPRQAVTRGLVGAIGDEALPEFLRRKLVPSPIKDGRAVFRVTFTGPQASEPVLSRIARVLSTDVNILAGHVEPIGGHPFGTLLIAVPGDVVTSNAVAAALQRLELPWEVLGYVP